MENILGISIEDIESFEDDPYEGDAAGVYAEKIANLTKDDVESLLNQDEDGQWLERARKIAQLPGIDNNVKIACMVLGVESILGQLFLLHGTAEGLSAQEAINAFSVFCEAVGVPTSTTTGWIAFYFFAGVLSNQTDPGGLRNLAGMFTPGNVDVGPTAKLLSTYSAPALELLVHSVGVLQPLVEELGVEFGEDEGLIDAVAERRKVALEEIEDDEDVIDIASLAPTK